jgi:integrase
MNTAVDDGLIRRNPCRIKGAGSEDSPERPVLTVRQVYALADAVGPRYRALILLATFTSLRWAELAALTPHDIDAASGHPHSPLPAWLALTSMTCGTLGTSSPPTQARTLAS